MKRMALLIVLCAAALPARTSAQLTADPWFRAGTWMLTVEVGGAAFSDFERTQARPVIQGTGLGDFSRRVSAQTAGSVGAWASYWFLNGWGVRGGVSYVPTSFTVWIDEPAQSALDDLASEDEDPSYASLGIWMANASAVFRFPHTFGRVTPYGIAGVGMIRYNPSSDAAVPPEASARLADGGWQTTAAMLGIGAAIPLQRSDLLMSFELTSHVARAPLRGGSGDGDGGEMFELAGVTMQLEPDAGTSDDGQVGLTNHFRLALGLTLPLR